jgi:SAM-dependent methyltransferase
VVGFDGSLAMLSLARRIVCGKAKTEIALPADGFGKLTIPGRRRDNVYLFRADVERLPVATDSADLALSVNVVDRLPKGPEPALAECHRILRPGGHLLFTDPLNFTSPELWKTYGNGAAIRKLLRDLGFRLEVWFDDLAYREIIDARGSFEEFKTLVILACKAGGRRR